MLPFILVVCFAAVFCLAPIALYALWLIVINRKSNPTIISGPLDFASLLAGLSGFILFGGGLLLSLLQSDFRILMRGNREPLRDAWGHERQTWYIIVAIYLIVVVGGAAVTLLSRRNTLLVYNIELEQLESTLTEILEQLGKSIERRGNLWLADHKSLLESTYFEATKTGTIRWVGDDLHLFQDIERHLRGSAPSLVVGESPIARWLMSFAVTSLIAVTFSVILLIYGLALIR